MLFLWKRPALLGVVLACLKDCPVGSVKSSVSSDRGTCKDCHCGGAGLTSAVVHMTAKCRLRALSNTFIGF